MATILYKYLAGIQHPATGLIESFPSSADVSLHGVAFTYDLALSGLVFTHRGSLTEAGRIADFFLAMPLPSILRSDFNTAYGVSNRLPALEDAFQLGPMAWVALSLMRYARASQQVAYFHRAVALLDWVCRNLTHSEGGVVMGMREPWLSRMSVENNWVYYAALRIAGQLMSDGPARELFRMERLSLRRWLQTQGGNRGRQDPIRALDVYSHALLVGPTAHLDDVYIGDRRALAWWARDWIAEADALFSVPRGAGFDYTDAKEAARIGRDRMSWFEGTEQLVVAYQSWAPFFEDLGELEYAHGLVRRASYAHASVMRSSLIINGAVALPNTDAPEPAKTFSDGWMARPADEPALNSTAWTYFAEAGFNPFIAPPNGSF